MSVWQPFSRDPDVVLGPGRGLWFHRWSPDRELNPQYEGIPDVERYGASLSHPRAGGDKGDGRGPVCWSGVTFDGEEQRALGEKVRWAVASWEPLTLSPSLLCLSCGDHGWVRDGKWVPA